MKTLSTTPPPAPRLAAHVQGTRVASYFTAFFLVRGLDPCVAMREWTFLRASAAIARVDIPLCDRSDEGRPCRDPETDEPCGQCQAAEANERDYWLAEYRALTPGERMTEEERNQELTDAGRGHLRSDR